MKEEQEFMKKFVRIVERYPEVYNMTLDAYKMTAPQKKAWAKIANCVKNELKEECPAEELRSIWKGIHSSFVRYLFNIHRGLSCDRYYLADSLKFLEPFIDTKSASASQTLSFENESSPERLEFEELDLKSEVIDIDDTDEVSDSTNITEEKKDAPNANVGQMNPNENYECMPSTSKRPRYIVKEKEQNTVEDNDDLMLFFRSMIPDLKHLTPKEKRQFKIGVLGLVDVIQDLRPRTNGLPNS